MDLIAYRRISPDRWIPTGRGKSPRGATIVDELGLHDAVHVDRYADHVQRDLIPDVEAVQAAIAAGDQAAVQQEWSHLVRWARPERPWSALSYDVIDHYFDANTRSAYGLTLTRP